MNVLALTIFVTLALVIFFVVMFVVSVAEGRGGPEDALLPLEKDASEQRKEGPVA